MSNLIQIIRETKNENGHISESENFTVRFGNKAVHGMSFDEARAEAITWSKMYKTPITLNK